MDTSKKIAFIGAGKMATAIGSGLRRNGVPASNITAYDVNEKAARAFCSAVGSPFCATLGDALSQAEIVFLAVKPQFVPSALENAAPLLGDRLLISIAAGISLETLVSLAKTGRVVRVMPNTPALIGAGVSCYAGAEGLAKDDLTLAGTLLQACGRAYEVRENLLDAITGLSGSGPAYVMEFIMGLADGGVYCGMPRELALESAIQTVLGTALLCQKSGGSIAELRDAVISPAGTTARGILTLQKAGFKGTVSEAVIAGAERSAELSGK